MLSRLSSFVALLASCAFEADAVSYTGKNDFSGGYTNNVDLAKGSGQRGVVILRDGNAQFTGDCKFGESADSAAVLLLQGGTLDVSGQILPYGSYCQFRRTGGDYCKFYARRSSGNIVSDVIPADIVFGGSGIVTGSLSDVCGPVNFAMAGDARLSYYYSSANKCAGGWIDVSYGTILALNGGHAVLNTTGNRGGPLGNTGGFYAFNGGILETTYGDTAAFGAATTANGGTAYRNVCIYEKGGGFVNGCSTDGGTSMRSVSPSAFREPEGNVVWSIPIPEDHEINSMTFAVPPSVIIEDSTGSGSNATAVVDWDYDTEKVTNITVLCRGEAYSGTAGAVTANLRYVAGSENYLLSTPLVCETGPCQGGDVFFGGGYTIYFRASCTNDYHGATIVDMDMYGQYDTTNAAGQKTVGPYSGGSLSILQYCQFPNTERIVLKSGLLYSGSGTASDDLFPRKKHLELYGGYMGRFGKNNTFETITVGGRVELSGRSEDAYTRVTVTDTLYVDCSCLANGVTPALTKRNTNYAGIKFDTGAKVEIKDWSALPRGRRVVALDLSGVVSALSGEGVVGTPTLVTSDEGVLVWDATEKKLYARRHSDGMFLIFR